MRMRLMGDGWVVVVMVVVVVVRSAVAADAAVAHAVTAGNQPRTCPAPLPVARRSFVKVSVTSAESRIAKAYARAGDAANEALANIRTVLAYGGMEAEAARYDSFLEAAQTGGQNKGWAIGAALVRSAVGSGGGTRYSCCHVHP